MRKNYLLLLFAMLCLSAGAQTVLIDDVTLGVSSNSYQESPIDADDNYSYSQNIYLQSEINQAGTISKITFYTNGSLENSNDLVVYMAETTNDVLESTSGWLPLEDLTQVYAGTVSVFNNEVSIILDTPFAYSNTANLMIAVDENQDGSDTNDFISHNLGYSAAYGRVLHYGNNTTNPDPAAPPTGVLDYYRANIELDFNTISCLPPSAIEITDLTASSLNVNWTSAATSWDYVVQIAGTENPDAATAVETASNAIEITGLTSNTAYELYLRADCDTDGVSDWVGPLYFRTDCGVIADFSENFDAMPDDLETPYCWSTIATSTGTAPSIKVNASSSQSYSPENYYEMVLSADDTVYLISPESTTIADGTQRVEFAAKVNSTSSGDTTFKVGLMSDPTDASTFLELSSYLLSNSSENTNNYALYAVNIPYDATRTYLAFHPETTSTYNKTVYLDDIVLTEQPTCFELLDVTASNISATAFDLNLTLDTQLQTEWEIVVKQTDLNFNPALETALVSNSLTTSITVDSDGDALIPNSPYRVFVRAQCEATGSEGSGYSAWFGPYDTRTGCAPLAANFVEGFEGYEDGDFPFCWNKITASTGSEYAEINNSSSYSNTGENAIIFNPGNDANATMLLILPEFPAVNDGTRRLEFFAKQNSSAAPYADLIVGTMSDPTDASTFEAVSTVSITAGGFSSDFLEYGVNLPMHADADAYVAIKHGVGDAANRTIYIDDVAIVNQPTCLEVIDVEVTNISTMTADATWTLNTGQTDWQYLVQASGTENLDAATPVDVTSNTITISDLDSNTAYELFVRANCGTEGFSVWSDPVYFRTSCGAIADFSENFDAMPDDLETPYCWTTIATSTGTAPSIKVNESSSQSYSPDNYYEMALSADDTVYLISPESTTIADGTQRVEFAAKVNSTTSGETTFKVGLMSDPTDASTFLELSSYLLSNSSENTNNYALYAVNIPYDATRTYLAFHPETTSTYNKTVYLDDIVLTAQPTCFEVLDVTASNISATAFDLNLTLDYQTQTEWEIIVKQTELNFNPALETALVSNSLTTSITVDSDGNALIPNSPYRVFVRAQCEATGSEGSGYSAWFGPYDTRTGCAAFTANFTEDFEDYEDGDFPFCWNKITDSTGSELAEVNSSSSYANTGENAIIFNPGNDANATMLLILPEFPGINDGSHRLEFFAKQSSAYAPFADLIIGTMSDPEDASTFEAISTVSITSGGGYNVEFLEYAIDLPLHAEGDAYVAIKHAVGEASNRTIYIDDVTITDVSLGVNDFDLNSSLVLYPNPVTHTLNIEGDHIETLTIMDINGKRIMTQATSTNRVDVSNLESGMYFLKVTDTKGNSVIKKFVKA
ncbi:choice-of-anchor J domain-containing protein [Winogradskyella rapida]|uniref:Choice-of-anchor J domain-containing protein n=1 Tax=Winogradskyella rapida TaxID=549701 RepID=A0ABW3KXI3_9FLAO